MPFFFLLDGLPEVIIFLVAVMSVALVASSVDTLQSALAAMMARDLTDRRLTLNGAKILTVVLTVPAVLIALQGYDILRLFLIADLVAAATVVPVFLGLRRPASSASVVVGSLAGLASVVVLGVIQEGTLQGGIDLLTVASSPDLDVGSFILAPLVSGARGRGLRPPVPEAADERSAELSGGLAVDQPDDLLGPDAGGRRSRRRPCGPGPRPCRPRSP